MSRDPEIDENAYTDELLNAIELLFGDREEERDFVWNICKSLSALYNERKPRQSDLDRLHELFDAAVNARSAPAG